MEIAKLTVFLCPFALFDEKFHQISTAKISNTTCRVDQLNVSR